MGKRDNPKSKSEGAADRRRFPPVEEQLAEAKAIHGSAFAQFIQLNQETDLLRPEESEDDGIGYPLWLRVYWRKQHPELENAPAGPAGDYPEALDRIEEWMKANQELSPNADKWLNESRQSPKGGSHGN